MAAPFGSESMGNWQENRLIHRFENHPQNFLYQLICECRDSQRSLFLGIVLLLDIGSSGGCGLVGFISEPLDDICDFGFAESICRVIVCTLSCGTTVGIQIFICQKIQVWPQQIAIQSGKNFFLICE